VSAFRVLNAVAVGVVFGATLAWALTWGRRAGDARGGASKTSSSMRGVDASPSASPSDLETLPADARIASSSSRADQILLRLVRRERIAAVTAISQRNDPITYSGLQTIESLDDVESILDVRPDVVIVNGFFDPRRVARLRESGLVVHDLGPLDDLDGFVADIREVGALVGAEGRARRLARSIVDRMRQVAADIPSAARPAGIYLAQFGGKLYGGARGTSYHDVIIHGGLLDAARGLKGWPELDPETVLGIDPDYLVTSAGMGEALCDYVGLGELKACRAPDRVIEIPQQALGDPGLGMLDAAEALRRAVHGPPEPPP